MAGEEDKLGDFYTTIKSGTTVSNFLEKCECIFRFIHSEGLTEDYRLGSGRLKKFRDMHAVLAGKALLQLRRNMGAREWREWVKEARISQMAILKYIRKAEALEVTALATAPVTRLFV